MKEIHFTKRSGFNKLIDANRPEGTYSVPIAKEVLKERTLRKQTTKHLSKFDPLNQSIIEEQDDLDASFGAGNYSNMDLNKTMT